MAADYMALMDWQDRLALLDAASTSQARWRRELYAGSTARRASRWASLNARFRRRNAPAVTAVHPAAAGGAVRLRCLDDGQHARPDAA